MVSRVLRDSDDSCYSTLGGIQICTVVLELWRRSWLSAAAPPDMHTWNQE